MITKDEAANTLAARTNERLEQTIAAQESRIDKAIRDSTAVGAAVLLRNVPRTALAELRTRYENAGWTVAVAEENGATPEEWDDFVTASFAVS